MAERSISKTEAGPTQLALLEAPGSGWRLDDRTRELGRRGVAEARAALRLAGGSVASELAAPGAEAA